MTKISFRNVNINPSNVSYDLYLEIDEDLSIENGKSLGIRVHEYGSIYDFTAESLIEDAEVRTASYGNGGRSKAFFLNQDHPKIQIL